MLHNVSYENLERKLTKAVSLEGESREIDPIS